MIPYLFIVPVFILQISDEHSPSTRTTYNWVFVVVPQILDVNIVALEEETIDVNVLVTDLRCEPSVALEPETDDVFLYFRFADLRREHLWNSIKRELNCFVVTLI